MYKSHEEAQMYGNPEIGACMNEWITSIQPSGLMKMRLMHHQKHHLGHLSDGLFAGETSRSLAKYNLQPWTPSWALPANTVMQ